LINKETIPGIIIDIIKKILAQEILSVHSQWNLTFKSITPKYPYPQAKEFNGDVEIIVDWENQKIIGQWGNFFITESKLVKVGKKGIGLNVLKFLQEKIIKHPLSYKYKCRNCVVSYRRSCCNWRDY